MRIVVGNFCRNTIFKKGKCPLTEDELLNAVKYAIENYGWKNGYREGVQLVPIGAKGFTCPIVELKGDEYLFGKYKSRVPGETPRKTLSVLGAPGVKESPAVSVDVVLYARHVLEEDGDEVDPTCDYEIVTILPKLSIGDQPMPVETLLANHFGADGGTNTKMNPAQFEAALRESFEFWKDKAMLY